MPGFSTALKRLDTRDSSSADGRGMRGARRYDYPVTSNKAEPGEVNGPFENVEELRCLMAVALKLRPGARRPWIWVEPASPQRFLGSA